MENIITKRIVANLGRRIIKGMKVEDVEVKNVEKLEEEVYGFTLITEANEKKLELRMTFETKNETFEIEQGEIGDYVAISEIAFWKAVALNN